MKIRSVCVSAALCLLLSVMTLGAQQQGGAAPPAGQGGGGGRGGQQPPQNLKILAAADVRTTMQNITAQLGVQCTYCHVQGNLASDEKPEKVTARLMLQMVNDINAQAEFFKTNARKLECFTCHHGAAKIPMAPPPPAPAPGARGGAPQR